MDKNASSHNLCNNINNNNTEEDKIDSTRCLSSEQMHDLKKELLRRNLAVGRNMTLIITGLELMMVVYALFVFDFSRSRHIAYMSLYCCLFVTSVAAFLCVRFALNKNSFKILTIKILTYSYLCIIILWAIGISLLDMMVGNQSVVFFTVIIGITGTLLLPPKAIVAIVALSIGLFLTLVYVTKCEMSVGFVINSLIFAVIVFILCFSRYKDFILDYLQRQELIRVNLRLELISKHDELTGLFNRSAMNDGLEESLARCKTSTLPLAVIMVDIDDFKQINDTFGHKVGDECIKALAVSIKSAAFPGEAYRYGGEEFFVILEGIEAKDAVILGQNIIEQVAQLCLPLYPEIAMTVSGGLFCASPSLADTTDKYLIRADRNLYLAKNAGKNRLIY